MIVPSRTSSFADWIWRTQLMLRRNLKYIMIFNAISVVFVISFIALSFKIEPEYIRIYYSDMLGYFNVLVFLFMVFVIFFDVIFLFFASLLVFIQIFYVNNKEKLFFSIYNLIIAFFSAAVCPVVSAFFVYFLLFMFGLIR
jgi:hypothetical protein